MGEIEDLVSLLKAKEDTKFAILNIVINASVSVSNRVNLAIKQHEDCIFRCIDKKSTINAILDSFDFSTTKAGQLFIHQGFYIGDDYNDRMDVLTNYYFNIGLNESEIEEDAKSFFILFHQRSSLLKILNKDETVRTELKKESDTKDDNIKQTEKENKQEDITTYLNLGDDKKKEWIHQGMQCDTVKELAKFIAQSYTNEILRKIPSKKGGGLWNLAKTAFQIEDTGTNRKTIENEFKLAYRPPQRLNKFK